MVSLAKDQGETMTSDLPDVLALSKRPPGHEKGHEAESNHRDEELG
jgi:hypothetical protein